MRTYAAVASGAAGFVALAAVLAGPALAMPTPVGSAQDVVLLLQKSGFEVIVNPAGTYALDQCTVTAVRPGSQAMETSIEASVVGKLPRTTVYVDVKC